MPPRTLTDAQVLRIRKQAHNGADYSELGEHYDKVPGYIAAIARGVTYKHVGGPITFRRKCKGMRKARRTTTAENGSPTPPDFATLPIDDAARFLQALAMEWPKIRASFLILDSIIGRQHDG